MSAVEHEIQHLDFSVEEERRHYAHPIDGGLWWCGMPRKVPISRPGLGTPAAPAKVTCVECLHLYIEKGAYWWWDVNRAWYGNQAR